MHTFIISGKKLLIAASSCLAAVLVAVGAGLLIAGKAASHICAAKKSADLFRQNRREKNRTDL